MDIETTIYDGAQKTYEEVQSLEIGSEQHAKAIQAANSMVDRLNEMKKIENENRKLNCIRVRRNNSNLVGNSLNESKEYSSKHSTGNRSNSADNRGCKRFDSGK